MWRCRRGWISGNSLSGTGRKRRNECAAVVGRGHGGIATFQASLRGAVPRRYRYPALETPGYFQEFLTGLGALPSAIDQRISRCCALLDFQHFQVRRKGDECNADCGSGECGDSGGMWVCGQRGEGAVWCGSTGSEEGGGAVQEY